MTPLQQMMPPVHYANVNGIQMAYYEAGPRQGVPVILCHGWPELAFSWRHQIKALADAGRWVIAPDQRGFGLTDSPAAVTDFDMQHLTDDLIGLLDHLGADKAIWVGHDWGGLIAWQMPLRHPDRTAGVIGLNTPFIPRLSRDPIALYRDALGEDMYIVFFQKPDEAEALFEADLEKTFRFTLRRPGPAAPQEAGLPLYRAVAHYQPQDDGRQVLNDDELSVFIDMYRRSGFRGGINWYRNFTRNWQASAHLIDRVEQPALMVMAEQDAVLPPSMADHMNKYCSDLEKALILGSGHWTQQEKPDEVNRVFLDWLDRRFPI
jgi:pimeloyl-ACP methyl ester carboxylesterase